jgi:hypothetical protein
MQYEVCQREKAAAKATEAANKKLELRIQKHFARRLASRLPAFAVWDKKKKCCCVGEIRCCGS